MRNNRSTKDRPRILVADDDRWLLESMSDWLSGNGYEVSTASNLEQALRACEQSQFDLMLSDVRFEDGSGIGLIRKLQSRHPELPVLAMTGYVGSEIACECIAAGAFDFLSKPIQDVDLVEAIDRAIEHKRIAEETRRLQVQLDSRVGLEHVVSRDPRMLGIFETIERVADARATVLITGENGTGKSLIARAVHKKSKRRAGPFVEVACGALTESLLDSELFGHVAGAFTGAMGSKVGKFQQAHGGTLFLDEIGTASPAMQVKLLRALQEKQFESVGGTETIAVDTRVILATNERLEQAVAQGRFRQDLFYRINVIRLELPPLRERIEDIPLLAQHFLDRACEEFQREVDGFSPAALNAMQQYRWPGNIRELENVIQRAVLLSRGRQIESDAFAHPAYETNGVSIASIASSEWDARRDATRLAQVVEVRHDPLPGGGFGTTTNRSTAIARTLSEALEEPERQIILEVLRSNQWNRNVTADQLGINRTTLYKKMKKLGIEVLAGDKIDAFGGNG